MTEETVQMDPEIDVAEELREQLDGLIRQSLSLKYTSFSSQNRIQTGNAYQSVQLRDSVYKGFRTVRSSVLAGLDIKNAKVLDLGCNLGEMSRLARKQGAALVDGFEYDSFFVQIGQAVNALNGISRVSLYQRDVTDPSVFVEPYDIVFSFSVFAYTQRVLPQIAMNCRQMFVLETHKVDANWPREYIDKVVGYFPYYCIVKRTDWGQSLSDGARLLLIYAHDKQEIANYIERRSLALGHDEEERRFLDVEKSDPECFREIKKWLADVPIDNAFALGKRVADKLGAIGDVTTAGDYRAGASGIVYWLAYLDGFFKYNNSGRIDGSNTYIQYLRRACQDLDIDPFMRSLIESDNAELYTRIQRRFDDTRAVLAGESTAPIIIYNPMPENAALPSVLVDSETGIRLSFSHQDGYHRYFSCMVAGREQLPYRMIWHPQHKDFKNIADQSPGLEERMFAALVQGLFSTDKENSEESVEAEERLSDVA